MSKRAVASKGKKSSDAKVANQFCALPIVEETELPAGTDPSRAALIRTNRTKWVNGTVLHFHFFSKRSDGQYIYMRDGSRQWRRWKGSNAEQNVVREAFAAWKSLGIGLEFQEVADREDAEIRIGFQRGDGAWSYLGRDALDKAPDQRTMNFGWSVRGDPDTALHEIGHALGFPHEHQNPNAGIVWNQEAVYEKLAGPPNNWDRETTYFNIIRKISVDTVQGSTWDPDSIMHYPFEAGLINSPARYQAGLTPSPGLSDRDIAWVKEFYPPLPDQRPKLKPFESVALALQPNDQRNFTIEPAATRKYQIQTFGAGDTVMVLFEDDKGTLRYVAGDDDSGAERGSQLTVKLFKGRKYVLRIRTYYAGASSDLAVMMW